MSRRVLNGLGKLTEGTFLGRTDNGAGPPEVLDINDLGRTLVSRNIVAAGGSAPTTYTASSGLTLSSGAFSITNYGSSTAVDGISGWSGTGLIRRTGAVTYTFGTAVSLTAEVTGTLPVANGGTNASSASGTALDNITGFSSTGILRRTGAGTYTFGTTVSVAEGGTGIASGTSGGVPYYSASTTIASSAALTANQIVLGGGAGAAPAALGSLGTTTTVLHGNAAGAPSFSAVSLTADVSGTLPVANGGTGLTGGTSGGVLAYTAAGTIASSAALAANALVLGGGAGAVPATNSKWTVASNILKGNLNAVAAPAAVTGTVQHLNGADASSSLLLFDGYASSAGMVFRRADTTGLNPSAVQSGDVIGTVQAQGYGATDYGGSATVNVQMVAAENWTDSAQGGKLLVRTNPVGSTTIATVATLRNSGCRLLGTNTNDAAAAGYMGEKISSILLVASAVSLTSTTAADVTTISLSAGDWDVWGEVWTSLNASTTVSLFGTFINTTSATVPTIPADGTARASSFPAALAGANLMQPVGPAQISVTGSTTVYLIARATFAVSTCAVYGKLWARRCANGGA